MGCIQILTPLIENTYFRYTYTALILAIGDFIENKTKQNKKNSRFRNLEKNSSYAKVNILEKPEKQRQSPVNFTNHIFPKISSSERRPFKQLIFNEK